MTYIHYPRPRKRNPYAGLIFRGDKWEATIYVGGKHVYIGRFTDKTKAREAQQKKLAELNKTLAKGSQ